VNRYLAVFSTFARLRPCSERDALCEEYAGFYYAKLLEHIAAGIQSGEIKVPK